jgi:uncharacterized protein (DUF885 family)
MKFASVVGFGLLCVSVVPQALDLEPHSRLRQPIEQFGQDYGILDRFYSAPESKNRAVRLRKLFDEWNAFLDKIDFASLDQSEKVDYLLFRNNLTFELKDLDRRAAQLAEMADLLPFLTSITDLEDGRRKQEPVDGMRAAAILNDITKQVATVQSKINSGSFATPKRTMANRAAQTTGSLRGTLQAWFEFYSGYDPLFSWWCAEPYKAANAALQQYQSFVSERLVGISADDKVTIIGDPIGRKALLEELQYEMIPYSPEELIEIANKEFAWCENEMKKASREMGFGDDWKKALEKVKQSFVEPGRQPELTTQLAKEAIDFIEAKQLVTVPPLAKEAWRMSMMSPQQQLVAPFFLGGELVQVSYPTDGMPHDAKMMSMRGNNKHFTRAVVHHELIPGHHLQGFMIDRYRTYRTRFYTPFWMEGWALYWEFLLWDQGFSPKPEDRVGVLFWRMHRCARIIFSLSFHLEKMTPQECVDFLVDRVGHERDNALAEVRRSFAGDYGPLYQVAYMIGGLQFYNLHKELVGGGKMTNRRFHDGILREGPIPVEMVRAILTKQQLTKDFIPNWKFYR